MRDTLRIVARGTPLELDKNDSRLNALLIVLTGVRFGPVTDVRGSERKR